MAVVSVVIRTGRTGRLKSEALKHGVQADFVDSEGESTYIDLVGDLTKIAYAVGRSGATIIESNDKIPHDEPVYTSAGRGFH